MDGYFKDRQVAVLLLALSLGACEKAPSVTGGQPRLVQEIQAYHGHRIGYDLASTHYFEVSSINLKHPQQLKAFFRFRCEETYVPQMCRIYAWPPGTAPHYASLFPSDVVRESASYFLDKETGKEVFDLYPARHVAKDE